MTVEQRLDQLEKRNKRLTVALTMTVVTMCGVIVMGATYAKTKDIGDLKALYCDSIYSHTIEAERIRIVDSDGNMHMSISTSPADGFIQGHTKPMPHISMYMPETNSKAVHIGIDEAGGRIDVRDSRLRTVTLD